MDDGSRRSMSEVVAMPLSEYEQRVLAEIDSDLTATSAARRRRWHFVGVAVVGAAVTGGAIALVWLAMTSELPRTAGVAIALAVGVRVGGFGSWACSRPRRALRHLDQNARAHHVGRSGRRTRPDGSSSR
jgi:hypothetical protein